jgi:hypothetical protein
MPLAHPQSVNISRNYSEPVAVISFAAAKTGENVTDFQGRITERRLAWGQDPRGRYRTEISLTRQSAEELILLLAPVVGRDRIATMIDSP